MKVLKADPFALLSSLLNSLDSDISIATAHSELVVSISSNSLLSVGLEFLGRI